MVLFSFPNATKIGLGVISETLRSLILVLPKLKYFPNDFFKGWNKSHQLSKLSLYCDSLLHLAVTDVQDVILDSLHIDCKSALVTKWPPMRNLSVGLVFRDSFLPFHFMKHDLIRVEITNLHISSLINIPVDTHLTLYETSMQTLEINRVGGPDFTRVKTVVIFMAMHLSDLGDLYACPRALDLKILDAPNLSEISIRAFLTEREKFLSIHIPTLTPVHVTDKIYINGVSWGDVRDTRNGSNMSQVTYKSSEWPSMQKTNRILCT